MELFFLALLVFLMAAALGSGYPVAFALPGSAILTIALAALSGLLFAGDADAFFHSGGLSEWLTAGVTNLRGIYWEVERDTLIAIPLFIFMGIMLQRSKIAEDLLVAMAQLFGPVPGGLGISVVFVGALLAATTGILGATVVAMGMISLPAMLRNNYSKPLATGTIAASGTLGQIIPPSIVLIILADQLASASDQASSARKALHKDVTGELSMPSAFDVTSTSAGEMFLGAFIPGLLLVGLYMAYILIRALLRPETAPTVPFDAEVTARYIGKLLLTLVSPLALIFFVLGSIIGGIATVNQAGAIGAAGAIIMAGYRLKSGERNAYIPAILAIIALLMAAYALITFDMNIKNIQTQEDQRGIYIGAAATGLLILSLVWSGWRTYRIENTLSEVMLETAKTTSLVFIILLGAAMLTAAFRAFGGEDLVKHFLEGLPGGFWTKFAIVMLVIFVLGFFLDYIEIAVVVVPIVAPILLADPSANITAVWLGVMIGLNIQTSFLTPPFGFALFYLRGVAPAVVKTIDMYKGVIPFIALQLGGLAIVGTYPQLVNYLPNRVSLLSETAPPPRNPRLQHCLETYVSELFASEGDDLRGAIVSARRLDIRYLPQTLVDQINDTFDMSEMSFELMDDIKAAETAMAVAAQEYRPIHSHVRSIQRDIRMLEDRRQEATTQKQRARGDQKVIADAEAEIYEIDANIQALQTGVPSDWAAREAEFSDYARQEQSARQVYRRNVDLTFDGLSAALAVIKDGKRYVALQAGLRALEAELPSLPEETALRRIEDTLREVRLVSGSEALASQLSAARRAIKQTTPNMTETARKVAVAVSTYTADLEWRSRAQSELAEPMSHLHDQLSGTIGLRSLPKLTRSQALYVARCNAIHRDISLNF
ncbi:TRAP transporter large permease subunit [uncultured Roseovarius sp.]|uniref:TRAP transporter large permease subunit n=1 Tax=uncultured Roseovarius sp. TaxID=293344 RepID=UPI002627BCE2|nr:TRAP transporter large permease subunit [uncultured Roseovarius sp.]